jgi:asparagine synthase (glutamine-hydrolysing)
MIASLKRFGRRLLAKLSRREARALALVPPPERALIRQLRKQHLTYLSVEKLVSVASTVHAIEQQGLPGAFVEAGCALGGSTILIGKLKSRERPLRVYDVFDMIPPPTEEDGDDVQKRYTAIQQGESKGLGGDMYYGYQNNLYEKVADNLRHFGIEGEREYVHLIKGLVQDTLRVDGPVAFAHIDVDWYDPVMTCLERLVPHLVVGGSIILDDYHDWSGCRKATDEYFGGRWEAFAMEDEAGSLKITRMAPVEPHTL